MGAMHNSLIIGINTIVIVSMLAMSFFFLQNRFMYPAGLSHSNITPDQGKNKIPYKEVVLQTEDKVNITGWFLYPNKTEE